MRCWKVGPSRVSTALIAAGWNAALRCALNALQYVLPAPPLTVQCWQGHGGDPPSSSYKTLENFLAVMFLADSNHLQQPTEPNKRKSALHLFLQPVT